MLRPRLERLSQCHRPHTDRGHRSFPRPSCVRLPTTRSPTDVTVTWKDALTFESDGRSGFLIDSAIESWYCFAGAFGVIILVAMAGRWFVQVQQGLRPLYDVKDLCVHAWTLRVLLTVYILSALAFRPPPVLPSSDLLFDALSAVGFLSATKVGLIRIPEVVIRADTTLYGKSNIFEPRVTPLDEIRHVFIVSMESADEMAWPYTPEYCKQRNCEDIAPEYNTPHHMTPFFQSLIDKEENTFYTSQYKASIAYTSKSHFSMACGQLPEFEALIKNELQVDPPLPCLPDLLRVMDPAFKSAHWAVSVLDLSHDHDPISFSIHPKTAIVYSATLTDCYAYSRCLGPLHPGYVSTSPNPTYGITMASSSRRQDTTSFLDAMTWRRCGIGRA